MSIGCITQVPNGQVGCIKAISRATHIGLIELDSSFAGYDEALNINNWRVLIQESQKLFIFKKAHNWDNTTSDPTITEAEISKTKMLADENPPSYLFYLQANFCDYKELLGMDINSNFHVVYFLQDGTILITKLPGGEFTGMDALISAVTKGSVKEIENAFPLYVNHSDYKQWVNGFLLSPEWTVDDLLAYVPSGVSIFDTGSYNTTTGIIEVQVNDRCASGKVGLTDAEFEIVRSNVDTPAITTVAPVAGKDGRYDLTLDKTATPTSLEVGDEMVIRVIKKTGNIIDYVSNELLVIVKETTA